MSEHTPGTFWKLVAYATKNLSRLFSFCSVVVQMRVPQGLNFLFARTTVPRFCMKDRLPCHVLPVGCCSSRRSGYAQPGCCSVLYEALGLFPLSFSSFPLPPPFFPFSPLPSSSPSFLPSSSHSPFLFLPLLPFPFSLLSFPHSSLSSPSHPAPYRASPHTSRPSWAQDGVMMPRQRSDPRRHCSRRSSVCG